MEVGARSGPSNRFRGRVGGSSATVVCRAIAVYEIIILGVRRVGVIPVRLGTLERTFGHLLQRRPSWGLTLLLLIAQNQPDQTFLIM